MARAGGIWIFFFFLDKKVAFGFETLNFISPFIEEEKAQLN